jgi:arginase
LLVPYDTARRGWRSGAGPEHLRDAGLVAHLEERGHTVVAVDVIEPPGDAPLAEIATGFELMRRVAPVVRQARGAGHFPIVLSGNCNTAVGVLSALAPARRAVFWFDAHGDINTPETTTSGFLDGTGLAAALGLCWRALAATVPGFEPVRATDTYLLGVRDLDPPEAELAERSGITTLATDALPATLGASLTSASLDDAVAYVHVDLDAMDPAAVGRANALPVPGGLTVSQLTDTIGAIAARLPVGAATLASYAPEYDTDRGVERAAFAAIDAILAGASGAPGLIH